jgi:CheY-like chemotaxis protein
MNELRTILLAEDNKIDVELTIEALEDNKISNKVDVVRDGQEVLDYLYRKEKYEKRANGNPAVIVMDIKMPKIDGIEVLKQIKSDDRLKMIPVVMLTSSREEKDLMLSYNLGVNAYVVKPVDFLEFVEAIKQIGLFWGVLNELPKGSMINAG